MKDEDRTRAGGGAEAGHTIGGAAQPLAVPTHGEPTWSTSWRRLLAYKEPPNEKP
jgi:hypothetical protein